MIDKDFRPQKTKNNGKGVLDANLNSTSQTILIESGHNLSGVLISGVATSTGGPKTLNVTGAESLGYSVGELLYNVTKDLAAVITAIGTNSITTTTLKGANANKIWESGDEFTNGILEVQIQEREGQSETGEVLSFENVFVWKIDGDILHTKTDYRGVLDTSPRSFVAGDFVQVLSTQSLYDSFLNFLCNIEINKADLDDSVLLTGNQTIGGSKTFSVIPSSNQPASSANHLVRKQEFDEASNPPNAMYLDHFSSSQVMFADDDHKIPIYANSASGAWTIRDLGAIGVRSLNAGINLYFKKGVRVGDSIWFAGVTSTSPTTSAAARIFKMDIATEVFTQMKTGSATGQKLGFAVDPDTKRLFVSQVNASESWGGSFDARLIGSWDISTGSMTNFQHYDLTSITGLPYANARPIQARNGKLVLYTVGVMPVIDLATETVDFYRDWGNCEQNSFVPSSTLYKGNQFFPVDLSSGKSPNLYSNPLN